MSLALAGVRAAVTPRWISNELWRRARAVPSVDFDFSSGSMRDRVSGADLITYTRPSLAWGWDGSQFVQFANDTPRIVVDPTTGLRGLLVEEARTNSVRNGAATGAVAGTPGTSPTNWVISAPAGITQQIIGTGTESGIPYVEFRYSGTATGSLVIRPEGESFIVASSGQAWTGSVFVRLVSGSFANCTVDNNIRQGTAAGTLVASNSSAITPTSAALGRQSYTNTATMQATTERVVNRLIFVLTGAVDFTVRIGGFQLELGAFPTSPIITTGSALTRSADVAVVSGANFPAGIVPSQFTLYADAYREFAVPSGQFPAVLVLTAAGASNTDGGTLGYLTESLVGYIVRSDSAIVREIYPSGQSGIRRRRIAGAGDARGHAASANGAAAATGAASAMPASVAEIKLGSNATGGAIINGIITRTIIWPTRLSDATLQALTA